MKNLARILAVTAIALPCSSLISLQGLAQVPEVPATTVSTVIRPNIWWRQVSGSAREQQVRLAISREFERSPADATEVYLVVRPSVLSPRREITIEEFFGGRTWKVTRQFGDVGPDANFETADGKQLDLVYIDRAEPTLGDGERETLRKPSPPTNYRLQQISAFGLLPQATSVDPARVWVRPSVERSMALDQHMLSCDPVDWGIEVFDVEAKRLWQQVVVAYGPSVSTPQGRSGKGGFDPYSDECWTPGQREISTVQSYSMVLRDDTTLLVLGSNEYESLGVLRIRLKDGRPAIVPPNISVMAYAGVMRLKATLVGADEERYVRAVQSRGVAPNTQATNFLMIQAYFFPDLLRQAVR